MRNVSFAREEAHSRYILENLQDIVWEADSNLVFTYVNPAVKDITGYTVEEILGRNIFIFLTKEFKEHIFSQWQQNVAKRINDHYKDVQLYDMEFVCKDGHIICLEVSVKPIFKDDIFQGYLGIARDVTAKRRIEQDLRKYLEELQIKNNILDEWAMLDMLTGTYNRRKFDSYAHISVENAQRYGIPFSVMMFDIDNFKQINDSLGHKKGDLILREIATRIQNSLRDADKLFRWGGDEFIVLLPGATGKDAAKAAERLRKAVASHDFQLEDLKVTISIGVGEFCLGETLEQLITRVDNALLLAKSNGKNCVELSYH